MTADPSDDGRAAVEDRLAATILVENHRAFLRYLERRIGNRALAEDLLQDAFVRNLDGLSFVPEEGLVPWFLAFTRELSDASVPAADMRQEICACVGRLAQTLKPEYAEALKAVDIDEMPVKGFATAAGLTPSNAGVRLFRARAALRRQVAASCGTCAEHGCVDCSCGKRSGESSA